MEVRTSHAHVDIETTSTRATPTPPRHSFRWCRGALLGSALLLGSWTAQAGDIFVGPTGTLDADHIGLGADAIEVVTSANGSTYLVTLKSGTSSSSGEVWRIYSNCFATGGACLGARTHSINSMPYGMTQMTFWGDHDGARVLFYAPTNGVGAYEVRSLSNTGVLTVVQSSTTLGLGAGYIIKAYENFQGERYLMRYHPGTGLGMKNSLTAAGISTKGTVYYNYGTGFDNMVAYSYEDKNYLAFYEKTPDTGSNDNGGRFISGTLNGVGTPHGWTHSFLPRDRTDIQAMNIGGRPYIHTLAPSDSRMEVREVSNNGSIATRKDSIYVGGGEGGLVYKDGYSLGYSFMRMYWIGSYLFRIRYKSSTGYVGFERIIYAEPADWIDDFAMYAHRGNSESGKAWRSVGTDRNSVQNHTSAFPSIVSSNAVKNIEIDIQYNNEYSNNSGGRWEVSHSACNSSSSNPCEGLQYYLDTLQATGWMTSAHSLLIELKSDDCGDSSGCNLYEHDDQLDAVLSDYPDIFRVVGFLDNHQIVKTIEDMAEKGYRVGGFVDQESSVSGLTNGTSCSLSTCLCSAACPQGDDCEIGEDPWVYDEHDNFGEGMCVLARLDGPHHVDVQLWIRVKSAGLDSSKWSFAKSWCDGISAAGGDKCAIGGSAIIKSTGSSVEDWGSNAWKTRVCDEHDDLAEALSYRSSTAQFPMMGQVRKSTNLLAVETGLWNCP